MADDMQDQRRGPDPDADASAGPAGHLIGVISDTHGLLRPSAVAALRGVEMIVHAGDIGSQEVYGALERIAPLAAVRGNTDRDLWTRDIPARRTLEVGDARLFVVHNLAELWLDPAAEGYAAVIFGHSHRPLNERRDGVLYLNPGSAGPRRFNLPVALARLRVRGSEVSAEIIPLEP